MDVPVTDGATKTDAGEAYVFPMATGTPRTGWHQTTETCSLLELEARRRKSSSPSRIPTLKLLAPAPQNMETGPLRGDQVKTRPFGGP